MVLNFKNLTIICIREIYWGGGLDPETGIHQRPPELGGLATSNRDKRPEVTQAQNLHPFFNIQDVKKKGMKCKCSLVHFHRHKQAP